MLGEDHLYCNVKSPCSLSEISKHIQSLQTNWSHHLSGPRLGAHFSNTSSTATCSPSPQAGSGSACELQPSEKEPPLQREDRERDSKQEGGERERTEPHQIVPTVRPEPPRAKRSTKADHAATETEERLSWNHNSNKMKRTGKRNVQQKLFNKKIICATNAANRCGRGLGPHVKRT